MGNSPEIVVAVTQVVDYLRIIGLFNSAWRKVVQRKVTAEEARKIGLKVSDKELQQAADAFRIANGLNKASDTERWLKSNGISLETLEEYLETNLLIKKFKDKLEKETNKEKYLTSDKIKESVREMIYEDWLEEILK